jgi:hypothetical protein
MSCGSEAINRNRGRPWATSVVSKPKYYLVGVLVVGLPLPQPTTETTLRASTNATRMRFIVNLQ